MKKKGIVLSILIVLILFGMLLIVQFNRIRYTLPSQMAAERWANGNGEYAQISVFFPESTYVKEHMVTELRIRIEDLMKASEMNKENETNRVWVDAYCGFKKDTITNGERSQEVNLIGVGGDFFLFHPLELLKGGYIREEDLNNNRILLEETVAWRLFGSNDIMGKEVWISGNKYWIDGVVKERENSAGFLGFVPFENLNTNEQGIVCYEAVLPNPVTQFAKNHIEQALRMQKIENDDAWFELFENTNRFTISRLWEVTTLFFNDSMYDELGIKHPYWERNARKLERNGMVLIMCLSSYLIITSIFCVVIVLKIRNKILRKIKNVVFMCMEHKKL